MPAFLLLLAPFWSGLKTFVSAVFGFFAKPPGIYVLAAILLVLAVWLFGNHEYTRGSADAQAKEQILDAQARAQAIADAMIRQRALDSGLITAADHAGFLRGQAQARTITITKEIPTYVTAQTDQSFPMPCGLIRLHDAAALGADPAALDNPSGLADGETCPVKASDLAGIIVWNYGLYHQAEAQIVGLQDLARALAASAAGKDGKVIVSETAQ